MAYPVHFRVRFGGFLGDSSQSWSVGINYAFLSGDISPTDAGNQSYLERWRDGIVALNGGQVFPDTLRGLYTQRDALTYVRCSLIGTDGKEIAVALYEAGAPKPGAGGVNMPNQICVAISWVTGIPGRANAGRVYWPATGAALGPTGRLNSPSPQTIADAAADFLAAVAGAGQDVTDPARVAAVVSNRGTAHRIDRVRVGNRLDIQRRRADKQKEAYSVAQVAS